LSGLLFSPTTLRRVLPNLQRRTGLRTFVFLILLAFFCAEISAQVELEGRQIQDVSIVFDELGSNDTDKERYRLLALGSLGETYSAVRVRDAIAAIFETRLVENVTAEIRSVASDRIDVIFRIKRRTVARRVEVSVAEGTTTGVSEQELLLRLNLLDPGTTVSERILQTNAEILVEYLRDRGFYRAEATYEQLPLQASNEVAIRFRVSTGERATIDSFAIDIQGAENETLYRGFRLKPGAVYSRGRLTEDLERLRTNLRDQGFLAPLINEPRLIYDSETNKISVELRGSAGPEVEVEVVSEGSGVGQGTQRRLLPVKREGTVDFAAIIEGERRLENHFQERGYFFANVRSVCSVDPPLVPPADGIPTESEFVCSSLNSTELAGRKVNIKYLVDLNRRLKLVEIRLRGTELFDIEEIRSVLESQEANILGVIPIFGYGRGYTSQRLLENDAALIRSLLLELGYRNAEVRVNQGVSLDGENLIITFVVDEGVPTIITEVEIRGNSAFSDDELFRELPEYAGRNISIARVRNGQRALATFYSARGFFDASVNFSFDELPPDPVTGSPRFKLIFNIQNEGRPVNVNRIIVAGNQRTKTGAIERAVAVEPGALLRSADIYSSEQSLYSSDAFERVSITTRPAGDAPNGNRLADVVIEVQEQKPRLLQYGAGYSTDIGWSGFADIRHFNLLGNLWQGGTSVRWSQRRQLFQIDFVNPRFLPDRDRRFAPLTISAQYQRDSTVTRFFRSAFDRGTFGIVQRLDEDGNPIDEFGQSAGSPTLDRLTFTAETFRTLSLKDRSLFFLKYRFENVRLTNINSLLIRDLLQPDDRIRISGFGATFVRDTRRRCGIEYSILEIIQRGEPGDPCRYNASDPTNGDYFTAEYNVSLPALGANIGFQKFQASYNYYYTFPKLKNTTIAARGIIGIASVFSKRERFSSDEFPDLEGILPISERFFAGGSTTLRGFDFESAGPRVVVVPEGEFRNNDGESVFLDPFTVPFGGNALAVVNIEARVPVSKTVRLVPFYDGGNVFRRPSDIFKPPSIPESDIFRRNLRALWSHTVGVGFRLKTPVGGEFAIDYGYLLNPPSFIIPQGNNPPAFFRLPQGQLHFRFSQAF
jgi:outer membrane protein insertion porin family